jgi:hypothetical protein
LNQAAIKWSFALWTGLASDLSFEILWLYDLSIAALIPEGGSNIRTYDDLIRVDGTLGFTSIVKKRRKLGSKVNL